MTTTTRLQGGILAEVCRKKKGWSLRDAAEVMGISHNHVWKLERGHIGIGRMTAEKLAIAYDLPAARFRCGRRKT